MNSIQMQSIRDFCGFTQTTTKEEIQERLQEVNKEIDFLTRLENKVDGQISIDDKKIARLRSENRFLARKITFSDFFTTDWRELIYTIEDSMVTMTSRWKMFLTGKNISKEIAVNELAIKYLSERLEYNRKERDQSIPKKTKKEFVIKPNIEKLLENLGN